MPVYEYECQKCGRTTEALRAMRDADAPIACEHCGSKKTARAHSVVAVGAGKGAPGSSLPMRGCGRCGDPNGPCAM